MAYLGVAIVILVGVVSVLWWILFPSKYRQWVDKIPGPKPIPLLGNAHQFERNAHDFLYQIVAYTKEYGKNGIWKAYVGMRASILLYKAETVEVLLSSTKHMSKSPDYSFLHSWLGTGLLTSSGAKWHTRRRLLTPTFHFHILQDFQHVFNEQSRIMVEKLQPQCGKGSFNIFPYITRCALDIICETAMGKQLNAQENTESEYIKSLYQISELVQERQKSPWFWPDAMYNLFGNGKLHNQCLKVLHDFTEKVIKERSAELDREASSESEGYVMVSGKKKRLAFLDMLLNASRSGADLDFLDIREEVDTFMFEGHDTTAAAMNWVVYLVGSHPDVQEKLHEELDELYGDDRSKDVTMDDIKQLKYLERVIKEALRLYPSVPLLGRTFSEDCEIAGYQVPKGAIGVIFTYSLHRDPKHFPDPERFDPDRWLPENSVGRHPYCYVPFSAGMRNCIGQKFAMNEEKVLLSAIFRNFLVKSCQEERELMPVGELVLRPENGIWVELSAR